MDKNEVKFKEIYKELKVPENCPGINWRKGSSDGDFDVEILPLLKKLNALEFCHTTGSCAGHTLREIAKNFKGWGVMAPYRMTITLHVKIDRISDFQSLMAKMFTVSNGHLWCELGYKHDWNMKVEKGYIPFEIIVFGTTKKRRDKLLEKYLKILS